jgi:hypothetical protein
MHKMQGEAVTTRKSSRKALALLVFIVAVVISAGAASAADKTGNYFVRGFGSQPCERYLAERKANSPAYLFFREWANGYVTAYSQFGAETYDAAADFDLDAISGLLETFCNGNKKRNFATAVYAVTRELHKYRIVSQSPVASVDAGKGKIHVFEETVRRVQQTLKQQGIYKGEVDGKFGKGTASAIGAYQKKKKLPETGVPDRRTLLAIYQEWK